jgi:hypothetical protein
MKAQPKPTIDLALIVIDKNCFYTLPIEGWPNYHASTCGHIISTQSNTPIVLAADIRPDGYVRATLSKDGATKRFYVHRLVAQTFLESPNNDRNDAERVEVNHIDSDRGNNKLANLEWCSKSENTKHAFLMRRLDTELLEVAANV